MASYRRRVGEGRYPGSVRDFAVIPRDLRDQSGNEGTVKIGFGHNRTLQAGDSRDRVDVEEDNQARYRGSWDYREMELNEALRQFDRTEVNLRRLEEISAQLQERIPDGIEFPGSSPEGREHASLRRSFHDLTNALPAIDGFQFAVDPPTLDDIAQSRLDAAEIDEPEILIALGRRISEPDEAIDEYRHRLKRARRILVRRRADELVAEVDALLPKLTARFPRDQEALAEDPEWLALKAAVNEIRRLLASESSGGARWGDLMRHLGFGLGVDLHDIADYDWPSVRENIESRLYAEDEPLPIAADDLGALVASDPSGPVTTELDWSVLDDEGFERLIFNLLGDASGYENPQWLTRTNAPDRGRDLSVDRVRADSLGGTARQRLMVQCKHWTTRSVGPDDAAAAVTRAGLWEPPFDGLIIATSGRFTGDAVTWIENHNRVSRLGIEMWPDSHLEMLLANRPYLVEEFNLRSRSG